MWMNVLTMADRAGIPSDLSNFGELDLASVLKFVVHVLESLVRQLFSVSKLDE